MLSYKKTGGFALFLVVGLSLGGCTAATQKQLLLDADAAQRAATETYSAATAKQSIADAACASAWKAVVPRPPAPATAAEKDALCAQLGVPLPFPSKALQSAAGPVNGLHDVILKANAVRTAPGTTSDRVWAALGGVLSAFVQVTADLTAAGIGLPPKVLEWTDSARKAGVQ